MPSQAFSEGRRRVPIETLSFGIPGAAALVTVDYLAALRMMLPGHTLCYSLARQAPPQKVKVQIT